MTDEKSLKIIEKTGRANSMKIFTKKYTKDIMTTYFNHPIWKIKPDGKIPDMPLDVQLELINRCNLKCSACPILYNSREKSMLTWDILKKIADEIQEEDICYITICGIGEASLHPNLFDFLNYVRNLKIKPLNMRCLNMIPTVLISNVVWNKKHLKKCIENPPDLLSASVAGLTDEEITERRGSIDVNKFYNNLKFIYNNRNIKRIDDKGISPTIHLSTHVYPHEMETRKKDIEKFKEKWFNVCDSIIIKPTMIDQHHAQLSEFNKKSKLKYIKLTETKFERTSPCMETSRRLSVNSDGKIWCGHHNSEDFGPYLGDVYKNTLREIWHSHKMNEFRKEVRAGIFKRPGCKACGGEIRDFHRLPLKTPEKEIEFFKWGVN